MTHLSAESRQRFDLLCCCSSKYDVDANLVQAGTNQAKKINQETEPRERLKCKTDRMASKLNHESVSRLLSSGDVASNELYYQDPPILI